MRVDTRVGLLGALLLAGCAPVIHVVRVDPVLPPEGGTFTVRTEITATSSSRTPQLSLQHGPAPAPQGLGPEPMASAGTAGDRRVFSAAVPGGSLTPTLVYGMPLKLTVSVPWADALTNINYVRQTLDTVVGAPANCPGGFDDPQRTQGWRLGGFRRMRAGEADTFAVSTPQPAWSWVAGQNHPRPVPNPGAVSLGLSQALRDANWAANERWLADLSHDWSRPARAVRVAVKSAVPLTLGAFVTVEYRSSVPEYLNARTFDAGETRSVASDGAWAEYELPLVQAFPAETWQGVGIPGRLSALTLRLSGPGRALGSAVGQPVYVDWVCLVAP